MGTEVRSTRTSGFRETTSRATWARRALDKGLIREIRQTRQPMYKGPLLILLCCTSSGRLHLRSGSLASLSCVDFNIKN